MNSPTLVFGPLIPFVRGLPAAPGYLPPVDSDRYELLCEQLTNEHTKVTFYFMLHHGTSFFVTEDGPTLLEHIRAIPDPNYILSVRLHAVSGSLKAETAIEEFDVGGGMVNHLVKHIDRVTVE